MLSVNFLRTFNIDKSEEEDIEPKLMAACA